MNQLAAFKEKLCSIQSRLGIATSRPFYCDGSPYDCHHMVVGKFPKTAIDNNGWEYWSNDVGFDMARFDEDYRSGKVTPTHERMDRIRRSIGSCVVVNAFAQRDVGDGRDANNEILKLMLREIKPSLVISAYKESFNVIRRLTNCQNAADTLIVSNNPEYNFKVYRISNLRQLSYGKCDQFVTMIAE